MCRNTRVGTCSNTRASILPYGESTCAYTSASTCSNTRASTCSNTRASTCYYACARRLFKNMRPGSIFWQISEKFWAREHPKRVISFMKEAERGERVVLGHFHERVDKSPGRLDTNILAPADQKISFGFQALAIWRCPTGPNHISLAHFRSS